MFQIVIIPLCGINFLIRISLYCYYYYYICTELYLKTNILNAK